MPELELAWAAGFFDGEGHVRWAQNGAYSMLRSQVAQVSIQPLERFIKAIGFGKIYGPYQSKQENHSPYYQISFSTKNTLKLIELLYPYLCSPKQEQITAALVKHKNTC